MSKIMEFLKGWELDEVLVLLASFALPFLRKGHGNTAAHGGAPEKGAKANPPAGETGNVGGFGGKDEALIVQGTFGSGLGVEHVKKLAELWASLTPYQKKQLRIRITAVQGDNPPKESGVLSRQALTLKGLAESIESMGLDKTKALLIDQGVIDLYSPMGKVTNTAANFLGLETGVEYSLDHVQKTAAMQLNGWLDKKERERAEVPANKPKKSGWLSKLLIGGR